MAEAVGAARAGAGDVRVALIGFGLAGAAFHAPLIEAVPGLRLTAIVTGDPGRAARARATHPAATVLDRPDALFAEPERYDLVVVASPNRAHVPLAAAALEAGLHVVVDKPFAPSAAAARRLAALADRRGRVLAVFHNRRWDGDMLTLRRLLDDGSLGAVHRFESRFERWRPAVDPHAWRELPDPEDAGGVLFDLGSHLIDQALVLFGEVRAVHAEIDRRRPGARVDDDVFVALEHASGVRSHLWMSQAAAHAGPRMRVLGSRGAYVKWGLDVQEDALRGGGRPDREPGWGREPPERWGTLHAGERAEPVETEPGDYRRFYAGVLAAVRDGAPPPVSGAEAIPVLDVIELAREVAVKS